MIANKIVSRAIVYRECYKTPKNRGGAFYTRVNVIKCLTEQHKTMLAQGDYYPKDLFTKPLKTGGVPFNNIAEAGSTGLHYAL